MQEREVKIAFTRQNSSHLVGMTSIVTRISMMTMMIMIIMMRLGRYMLFV